MDVTRRCSCAVNSIRAGTYLIYTFKLIPIADVHIDFAGRREVYEPPYPMGQQAKIVPGALRPIRLVRPSKLNSDTRAMGQKRFLAKLIGLGAVALFLFRKNKNVANSITAPSLGVAECLMWVSFFTLQTNQARRTKTNPEREPTTMGKGNHRERGTAKSKGNAKTKPNQPQA